MDVYYKGYEDEYHIYIVEYKGGFYKINYITGSSTKKLKVSKTNKHILSGYERKNNSTVNFFLTQVEKAIKKFIRKERLNNILGNER